MALLGRNGAGKTTTVKSIMGLVSVRGGRIRCDGEDVVGHQTESIAQFGIGYVPEDRRMFPGLTVRENFRLAALGSRASKADQQTAQRRALEVFRSWSSTSTATPPGSPVVSSRWWPSDVPSSAAPSCCWSTR